MPSTQVRKIYGEMKMAGEVYLDGEKSNRLVFQNQANSQNMARKATDWSSKIRLTAKMMLSMGRKENMVPLTERCWEGFRELACYLENVGFSFDCGGKTWRTFLDYCWFLRQSSLFLRVRNHLFTTMILLGGL
jgi:hypothetical protein